MKKSNFLTPLGNESEVVQQARRRITAAETAVETAKQASRTAKEKRAEAKKAARRAKKRLRSAKEELAEARRALADVEEMFARKTPRPESTKRARVSPAAPSRPLKTARKKRVGKPGSAVPTADLPSPDTPAEAAAASNELMPEMLDAPVPATYGQ